MSAHRSQGQLSLWAARGVVTVVGVGALAVTGAATGLASEPRAGAPNWDAIAQCESGGNWSTDTGNGYSGGLQFSESTWRAHGGTGKPSHASRDQQIQVAERVVQTQGLGAWPHCGRSSGKQSGGKQQAPSQRASAGASAAASPASPASRPSTAVATSPRPVASAVTSRSNPNGDYTIQPGDTLSGIADRLDVVGGWAALARMNAGYVVDPSLIRAGDRIATK